MRFKGPLAKMRTSIGNEVRYYLEIGDDILFMNDLIGKELNLSYLHKITCFCGDEVTSVFRMNFCRDCFFNKPQAGDPILRPELSKAHLGEEDRDLAWEREYQLQPHLVYLANSAGLKVGVTRIGQRPTRWIDQGATQAIVLAETSNRYEAGMIEVALKEHMSDKTPWKKMVKGEDEVMDMIAEKNRVRNWVPAEYAPFISDDNAVTEIRYPVREYPANAKTVNLEKSESMSGTLTGIRGQYLLFQSGVVLNVRAHEGRHVQIEF